MWLYLVICIDVLFVVFINTIMWLYLVTCIDVLFVYLLILLCGYI